MSPQPARQLRLEGLANLGALRACWEQSRSRSSCDRPTRCHTIPAAIPPFMRESQQELSTTFISHRDIQNAHTHRSHSPSQITPRLNLSSLSLVPHRYFINIYSAYSRFADKLCAESHRERIFPPLWRSGNASHLYHWIASERYLQANICEDHEFNSHWRHLHTSTNDVLFAFWLQRGAWVVGAGAGGADLVRGAESACCEEFLMLHSLSA